MRETLYRDALEYLQSPRSEKKRKKVLSLRKRLPCFALFDGLWSVGIRALISGPASAARRKPLAGPPGGEKNATYPRIYAENQVTERVSTPPQRRKGVYQDALGRLRKERAVLICL